MPTYVYNCQYVVPQQVEDSIGLKPTACGSDTEASVTFDDPLSAAEKQSLDDFMQDLGFSFVREVA
jgi:hypothetical protein